MHQAINSQKNIDINKCHEYYIDIRDFKNFFIKNCLVEKKYECFKVWSHWLIRNLCESTNANYHIIPSQIVSQDQTIIDYLQEKGHHIDKIKLFYNEVISKVTHLYQTYHQFKIDQLSNKSFVRQICSNIQYSKEIQRGNIYHIYKFQDIFIKHNDIKYNKLISMYNGDPDNLHFYMFEIGYNYHILDGQSLQWALPPKLLSYLKDNLSMQTELFASPINTHSVDFYSLFEIDKLFGAKDNFFNISIDTLCSNTYEINPPFIENIFIKSSSQIIHILQNFQNLDKDIMFIYIMPDWLDSKGYQMLINSQFLIDELIFKEKNHYYYQSSNNRFVSANFISHMLIIGTTEAQKKWTTKIKKNIIHNFTHTIT